MMNANSHFGTLKYLFVMCTILFIVQQISATFRCNCPKNGKGVKFGTNETDTTQIKNRLGDISKISKF